MSYLFQTLELPPYQCLQPSLTGYAKKNTHKGHTEARQLEEEVGLIATDAIEPVIIRKAPQSVRGKPQNSTVIRREYYRVGRAE